MLLLFVIGGCATTNDEPKTTTDIVNKSIAYHDPEGNWSKAAFKLIFTEIDATRMDLIRTVSISNPTGEFGFYEKDEDLELDYQVSGDSCVILFNGSSEFTAEDRQTNHLTCERAYLLKDYYSYLYGLPMKLNDPGTIIHPGIMDEDFNGEKCYSVRVTYDEAVGSDIWNFYFDIKTFALRGYRFQHTLGEFDGEYITLDGLIDYDGMRIPQTRSWYFDKTGDYLATDELEAIEPL